MVTEQGIPSKAVLLDALRSSELELLAKLRALPEEEFDQGGYENGWTRRQILAHVASIEWTYPRLLDVAKQGELAAASESPATVRQTEPEEGAGLPTRTARGGIDTYNQRQVDKRAQVSVADLLAEFRKNRAATIAAVEGADEALLTTPIRSAGGVTGALSGVIYAVAVGHVLGHVNDIAGTG
jgi:hypothetical protein